MGLLLVVVQFFCMWLVVGGGEGSGHKKKPPFLGRLFEIINPGLVLLSHTAARAVPSALKGLTSVFGMGTGVALSLSRPRKISVFRTIEFV